MLVDRHPAGRFCWTDLAAHDRDAALAFYTALFGWRAVDARYGDAPDEVYTMLHHPSGPVAAALYAMDDAQKAMGIPSSWLTYVSVDDAGAAAARVREAGGQVIADAFEVMDYGRMALAQDPAGATLGLWEARAHAGAGIVEEAGAVGWNELTTPDPDAAKSFYGAVFGWTADDASLPGYTSFVLDGARVAGMLRVSPEMGPVPAAWTPYVVVDDADAIAARVTAMGGTVVAGPSPVPPSSRWLLFRDPQGAHLHAVARGG